MGVFNDAYRLENGVTQVKNEKPQHKWNGIFPVDKHINDHHPDIERQLDDNRQQKSVYKLYKPLVKSLLQVIKGKKRGGNEKEYQEWHCRRHICFRENKCKNKHDGNYNSRKNQKLF